MAKILRPRFPIFLALALALWPVFRSGPIAPPYPDPSNTSRSTENTRQAPEIHLREPGMGVGPVPVAVYPLGSRARNTKKCEAPKCIVAGTNLHCHQNNLFESPQLARPS